MFELPFYPSLILLLFFIRSFIRSFIAICIESNQIIIHAFISFQLPPISIVLSVVQNMQVHEHVCRHSGFDARG